MTIPSYLANFSKPISHMGTSMYHKLTSSGNQYLRTTALDEWEPNPTEYEDLIGSNSNIIYIFLQSPDHLVWGAINVVRVVVYLIGGLPRLQQRNFLFCGHYIKGTWLPSSTVQYCEWKGDVQILISRVRNPVPSKYRVMPTKIAAFMAEHPLLCSRAEI